VTQTAGIIYNPLSGSGRSGVQAQELRTELERRGFRVFVRESRASYHKTEILAFLRSVDIVVVSGGDGTLGKLLPAIAETERPVYMIPAGNESLFARLFAMRGTIDDLLQRIETGSVSRHYFGRVNNHPFFSMASLGLDSEVVAAISATRQGPIGHRGYVLPAIAAWLRHVPEPITLEVDGRAVVERAPGFLVISNSPEYALRMRLVPEAGSSKPELVARFFPEMSRKRYLRFITLALRGKPIPLDGTTVFTGREFRVTTERIGFPVQADGDFAGTTPAVVSLDPKEYLSVLAAAPTP
jgi:diacylglycerol kinase (ATP)